MSSITPWWPRPWRACTAPRPWPPAGDPLPYLLKLKAEALAAQGPPAEAGDALSQAAEGARQHQTGPILWQIEAARAHLASLQGRPADAQRAREAARATIDELAGSLGLPERETFRGRALSQLNSIDTL